MKQNITSNYYHYSFKDIDTEILAKYVGALAIILPIVTAFVRFILRPRVLVNCWFCNTNSRVVPEKTNSWYCYSCEQYNGFLPNGDYNKDLQEQRDTSARNGIVYAKKSTFLQDSNGLCDKCNANQEMKVKHLAAFEPVVPSNYDEELNIYCNQLENAYRLCQKCENVLSETLDKKKSLILGMQLKQSEKYTLGKLQFWRYSWRGTLHKPLVTLTSVISLLSAVVFPLVKKLEFKMLHQLQQLVQSNYCTVLAVNVLLQLLLTLNTGRKMPFAVCVTHVFVYFCSGQLISPGNASYVLGSLSALTCFLTPLSRKEIHRGAFVRLQKVEKQFMSVRRHDEEQRENALKCSSANYRHARPPTPEETAPAPERREPACAAVVPAQPAAKPATTEPQSQGSFLSQCQDDSSSVDSAFSNHDSATLDNESVKDDVHSMIQSLNLGSQWSSKPGGERPPGPRHTFQSRRYGRNDKPVLNPARLGSTSPKSLNESSWVAGGFWQKQQDDSATSEQCSRPGSPATSVYSQASSTWPSSTSRPASPAQSGMFDPLRVSPHFPVYTPPFGPPNGFHQPVSFQPYMYAPPMSPLWNAHMFQPISPSHNSMSSASCSSASTCGSVRRRHCGGEWDRSETERDLGSVSSSSVQPKRLNFFEALWQNSAIIFYTSAFYVAVTVSVFLFHKW